MIKYSFKFCPLWVLVGWLFLGCQSYGPFYANTVQNWDALSDIPHNQISRVVYLLGDAGEKPDNSAPVLNCIKHQLKANSFKSDIVFLGDNIYPKGMPDATSKKRKEAESRIQPQLELAKLVTGKAIFLPGNHDWERGRKNGSVTLSFEEEYIEGYLNKGNIFVPDKGCPGPSVVELSEKLVIITIDVQWWLHKHKIVSGDNKCGANTKADFLQKIKSVLRESRGKTVILAAHHPLVSNGNHGGYFSLKPHLFPLTHFHSSLYIPLPVLGTLYVLGRKYLGNIQDLSHPQYKTFIKEMKSTLISCHNLIYTAGHEHNLQYFKHDNYHTIISGAASKTTWAARNKGALFTLASKGFARLIVTNEDESWIEFWVPSPSNKKGELVFRKKLIGLE